MLHRACYFGRLMTVTSTTLAIPEQLEVNRKNHESKEHDNALANTENKLSLCV